MMAVGKGADAVTNAACAVNRLRSSGTVSLLRITYHTISVVDKGTR
jgi:hypothetical protein